MMDEKNMIELQQPDPCTKPEEENKKTVKRASRAIFLLVVLLFAAVMGVTYFIEVKFGKTAGTIALAVLALIIALSLYGKEIRAKLKKKK